MKLRILATVAALLSVTPVFAAVNLTVPEELKVIAVNEQEIRTSILSTNQSYQLDAGSNLISVRYQQYFEHWDNSHDILKSGIVSIRTPELKDGETYHLALINAPKNFEDAQKFKDQPVVGLYDAKKQLLVQQAGAKDAAKPWFGNSVLGKTVDLRTKTTAPESQPAAIYTQPLVTPTQIAPSTAIKNQNIDQQLIQLWQKANKTERQKFMSWLGDQSN